MRFELGEDAAALREAAAALLSAQSTPAVIRAAWPGGSYDTVRAVWQRFAETGAVATLVPESADGLGLDENCLVPLCEELGRSGLPVPVVETIAVGAPLLAAIGDDRLAGVLGGELLVAAQLDGGDLVPFGQVADLFVLGDRTQAKLYRRDDLQLEPLETVDGARALARVTGRSGGIELPDVETAWIRGVLGTSALLTGLAGTMLDLTVGYVKTREQFGVPIGSFQAIKHALASALLALQFARPAALAAAWGVAEGESAAVADVSMAKVLASDAAKVVARTAIQSHGAIAYTTEYDLHLYAKRVWALAPSWGDAAFHRDRLAASLGLKDA
jgi:alkylation response protein AidB-like acyl-CoA dehydrogenase